MFGALGLAVLVIGIIYGVQKKPSATNTNSTAQAAKTTQPPARLTPAPLASQTTNPLSSSNPYRDALLAPRSSGTTNSSTLSAGNSSSDLQTSSKRIGADIDTGITSSAKSSSHVSSNIPSYDDDAITRAIMEMNRTSSPTNAKKPDVLTTSPDALHIHKQPAHADNPNAPSVAAPLNTPNVSLYTFTDGASGLMWALQDFNQLSNPPLAARRPMTRIAYAQSVLSLAYNQAHYGGYSDWRIPTKQEMETLCGTPLGRLVYQINFKSSPSFLYWTSTTDPLAVVMNCKTGKTGGVGVNDDLGRISEPTTIPSIRPVRGHLH